MINTIEIKNNKNKFLVENLKENMYLLPKWEKISTLSVFQNTMFFGKKKFSVNLMRKFSSKNMLEKYMVKSQEGEILANMDLRIYKDCVFVINFNFKNIFNIENIIMNLIQTAIEKALYNTSEQEVKISLTFPLNIRKKLKKLLLSNEFTIDENQSQYEKEMFGEMLYYKVKPFSTWKLRIKQNPILINK